MRVSGWLLAAFLVIGPALPVKADGPADFYRGRSVTLLIGFEAGSGYDTYARLIARFMQGHIPGNPTLVPQNMLGAAGMLAANYLYNVAARDGSSFGMVGRAVAFAPLLETDNAKFDPHRFNWLGNAGNDILIVDAWHAARVKTLQDALQHELLIGTNAATSDSYRLPLMLNATLGTKFKMITGYQLSQVSFAMERGEIEAEVRSLDSVLTTRSDWIRDKKVNVLVQTGFARDHRLPEVPLAVDYAKTAMDRDLMALVFTMFEMARPFLAPPGVPADRVAALRAALLATLRDPALLAEAAARKIDVKASSGEELEAQIRKTYATPLPVVMRAGELFATK